MPDVRNYEEYRAQALASLGEDYTVEDLRNEERFRSKVLDGLGMSYETEDLVNFEKYRLKVLQGIAGGGGGTSDFTTAEVTLQNVSDIISTLKVFSGVCMSETPNPMTGNYIDMMGTTNVPKGGTAIQKVLLCHGEVKVRFSADEIVSVQGNIVDSGDGLYKITGDCSVIAKGVGQA